MPDNIDNILSSYGDIDEILKKYEGPGVEEKPELPLEKLPDSRIRATIKWLLKNDPEAQRAYLEKKGFTVESIGEDNNAVLVDPQTNKRYIVDPEDIDWQDAAEVLEDYVETGLRGVGAGAGAVLGAGAGPIGFAAGAAVGGAAAGGGIELLRQEAAAAVGARETPSPGLVVKEAAIGAVEGLVPGLLGAGSKVASRGFQLLDKIRSRGKLELKAKFPPGAIRAKIKRDKLEPMIETLEKRGLTRIEASVEQIEKETSEQIGVLGKQLDKGYQDLSEKVGSKYSKEDILKFVERKYKASTEAPDPEVVNMLREEVGGVFDRLKGMPSGKKYSPFDVWRAVKEIDTRAKTFAGVTPKEATDRATAASDLLRNASRNLRDGILYKEAQKSGIPEIQQLSQEYRDLSLFYDAVVNKEAIAVARGANILTHIPREIGKRAVISVGEGGRKALHGLEKTTRILQRPYIGVGGAVQSIESLRGKEVNLRERLVGKKKKESPLPPYRRDRE